MNICSLIDHKTEWYVDKFTGRIHLRCKRCGKVDVIQPTIPFVIENVYWKARDALTYLTGNHK